MLIRLPIPGFPDESAEQTSPKGLPEETDLAITAILGTFKVAEYRMSWPDIINYRFNQKDEPDPDGPNANICPLPV